MKERHDMDRPAINTLGLCAGVGMLDLGVATALDWLGYRPRAAALCEWEAYAAACLLARMEDATLEPCPIWCGDLRDFDAVPFLGVVDVLAAGLPCQPYSVAGKQLGNVDHRSHGEDGNGPIPQFLRIVEECRPSVVFCENVPPWIRDGHFRPVGEELCRLGYTIEDPLFLTAEAVGASHKRERVFVMAHNSLARSWEIPESDRRNNATDAHGCIDELANAQGIRRRGRSADERVASRRTESKGESGDMAHAASDRRRALGTESTRFERGTVARDDGSNDMANAVWTQRPERPGRERVLDVCENAVGDAASERAEPLVTGSGSRSSIGESGVRLFAPGPNADWRAIPEHLWPSTTDTETQCSFRRMAHGYANFLDGDLANEIRKCEVLCRLWEATCEEANKRQARRSWRIQQAKVLQSVLHGLGHVSTSRATCAGEFDEEGEEVSEAMLRALRDIAGLASAPQGQKPEEQRAREPGDSVRDVPHEDAPQERRHCEACRKASVRCMREEVVSGRFVQYLSNTTAEIWQSVTHAKKAWVAMDTDSPGNDKGRADQLRCVGNAVVPLVAAVAFVELFQRVEKRINSKRSRRT